MMRLPLPECAAHAHHAFAELGVFEWLLVGGAAAVALWAIWKSVRYTLRPGETDPDHLKRMILRDDDEAARIDIQAAASAKPAGEN